MKPFFLIVHLIVALMLTGLILLQNSKGGLASGLGSGEFYRTKRGAERIIFTATFVAATVFLLTSIANILIHQTQPYECSKKRQIPLLAGS